EGGKLITLTQGLKKGIGKIFNKYVNLHEKAVKKQIDKFLKEKEIGKIQVKNLINAVYLKTKVPKNILEIYVNSSNPQPLAFFIKDMKGKIK
ncbi:MAG: hypothetical protein AAB131_15745, partial [Actinomycetota bacterium]